MVDGVQDHHSSAVERVVDRKHSKAHASPSAMSRIVEGQSRKSGWEGRSVGVVAAVAGAVVAAVS